MCDGAIAALCVVVGQLWGIHVAHEHSFNCDSGTTQQNWISSFIKPPLLFVDITDMGNSTSFDANSNKTTLIQQGQPVGCAILLTQCEEILTSRVDLGVFYGLFGVMGAIKG